MAGVVLSRVLPLAKGLVGEWLHNVRATLLRVLEVSINIRYCDVHVLRHPICLRTSIRPTLPTKHDGALRNGELRVANDAIALNTQALGETERPAQPIDRLTDVFVNQNRDNGRGWR